MISGKRYWGEDHEIGDMEEAIKFRQMIKELVTIGWAKNPADFMPILRWLDYDHLESRLKILAKKFGGFLQGLIDEHRNAKQRANTMIDYLLSLQESQPKNYTDQIIKGLILVSKTTFFPYDHCDIFEFLSFDICSCNMGSEEG